MSKTSETKHTPGPWVQHGTQVTDADGYEIADAQETCILLGYSEKLGIDHWANDDRASRDRSEQEAEANARLIAAAPQMLEALQDVISNDDLSRNDWDRETMRVLRAVQAAIAKATGNA